MILPGDETPFAESLKYNILDMVVKKRHHQVRRIIRLLYPVQGSDRYLPLLLG